MGKKVIGAILIVVGAIVMFYSLDGTLMQVGGAMMLSAGMSMIVAANFTPPSNKRSLKYNPRSGVQPRAIVYGNTVVGGPLVYAETMTGEDSNIMDFLHRIIVLAGHPIESIDKVWLSDEEVDLNAVSSPRGITGENWKIGNRETYCIGVTHTEANAPDSDAALAVRKAAGSAWSNGGTTSKSNSTTVISDAEAQNSTRKLNECPYLYVRLQLVEDGWNTVPTIKAVVKGKRIRSAQALKDYVTANPTHTNSQILNGVAEEYDNNSANCILDYLLDEKLGLGVPISEIDLDSFSESELYANKVPHISGAVDVLITENLKQIGTNVDYLIAGAGAQVIKAETSSLKNPMLQASLNPTNLPYDSGVRITLPDGTILKQTVVLDPRIQPYKYKLVHSSGPTPANAILEGSYIDVESGIVIIKLDAGYTYNAPGNIGIELIAASRYDSTRYACNGVTYTDNSPIQIVEELLTSCHGMLTYAYGKYKLYTGRWEEPKLKYGIADVDNNLITDYVKITEEDLAGPIQIRTTVPRSERFNAVKGVYANRDEKWELTDFPEVSNPTYKAADVGNDDYINPERNGYIYNEINLPFTTDVDTATRLAKLVLDIGRQSLQCTLTCKPSALQFAPGENVLVDLPSLGMGEPTLDNFSPAVLGAVVRTGTSIESIAITDGGSGYIHPPRLILSGNTPTQEAKTTVVIEGGSIKSILILDGGSGYSGVYTASFDTVADTSWNSKIFKVMTWSLDDAGNVILSLKEDAEAIYDDDSEVFISDPAEDTNNGLGRQSLTISSLSLTHTSKIEEGTFTSGIKASWPPIEDSRTLSYYVVEAGTGTNWRKKISSMSIEAARRDTIPEMAPTVAATAEYTWVDATTVTDTETGLQFTLPARLEINVTSGGSGYTPNKDFPNHSRNFYYVLTDTLGSGNSALIRFILNESTGQLSGGWVVNKTGDFSVGGPTAFNVDTSYEPILRAKANFTLAENILDYPSYAERVGRLGAYGIYVFDGTDLRTKTNNYSTFKSIGSNTFGDAFPTTFNNLSTCATIVDAGNLESYIPDLDVESTERAFSFEAIVSLEASKTTTIFSTVEDAPSSVYKHKLEITTTADGIGSTVRYRGDNGGVVPLVITTDINLANAQHIVFSEKGTGTPGLYSTSIFLNSVLIGNTSTGLIGGTSISESGIKTADRLIIGNNAVGTTLKIAAFNIYDKHLLQRDAEVLYQDLSNVSYPGYSTFADIESFSITDIDQREFNGYKGVDNNAVMTSDTAGSFDILHINEVSSFPAGTDGLPGANSATFGAFIQTDTGTTYKIGEIFRTVYDLDINNTRSPATNLLTFETPITGTTALDVGDVIEVYNVYDPNKEEDFAGTKVISKVNTNLGNIVSIEWDSSTRQRIVTSGNAVLDKDEAYLLLDYPQEFNTRKVVYANNETKADFFDGIINGNEHAVRVRAVDMYGKKGDWLERSIIATSDTTVPNPIYFNAYSGDREILFEFDFNIDPDNPDYDVADIGSSYHTETNLSHIELVVVREGTNRYSHEGVDPGKRSGLWRSVATIPISNNVRHIIDGKVEYVFGENLIGNPTNMYAWARLVTQSGVTSKWFSNDSGLGDGTEGVGPLRGDRASSTNLIGNDSADTTTTTTTATTSGGNDGIANPPDDITDTTTPGTITIFNPGGGGDNDFPHRNLN